ncbi:MAG: Glutamine--tRNA ligase [Hyphomicrobiaceae bacterium hypho_1]
MTNAGKKQITLPTKVILHKTPEKDITKRERPSHFVRDVIDSDLISGRTKQLVTRFPPEPNGFIHIGHAKSICLNFSMAEEFGGRCNLRLDDTNPAKEDEEYTFAIQEDVRWLGFEWADKTLHTSDYFEQLYDWAVYLIKVGKAFVDDLSAEEIRAYRGTLKSPGYNSPFRDRSVEENLDLFAGMRAGEYTDGSKVLRAKIDMKSGNINMRDPVIYRISHAMHPRTGYKWCIYPTYDFAHGQSDAIEGITHSFCTLEFADHRPLYDWLIENLPTPSKPKQIEFARLNMTYTVLSKRKLSQLVSNGYVRGWDDPRMPTLRGMRRRGIPAAAICDFIERIGIARAENTVEYEYLEFCIRELLNKTAERRMAVLKPLKVVIENYPEDKHEELEAWNNPEDSAAGKRLVPFCRELYIERDDFMEVPPKKFFRLAPGREVRLRYAYYILCTDVIKDKEGIISEVRCSYDPESRGGSTSDGRKVKGTIHWVSARNSINAEIRRYSHLFTSENPSFEDDFLSTLNPNSIQIISNAKIEPSLSNSQPGKSLQFERLGYFTADEDGTSECPVFNETVSLKDSWKKIQKLKSS